MRAVFTHLTGPRKGASEKVEADRITIGRAPDNSVSFDGERRVSSHHAEIRRKNNHYVLRDLGSTNGTMINGRRVVTSELNHDDLIEFGAGGPLVRFGVECNEAAHIDRQPSTRDGSHPKQSAAHRVGESTVEKMVDRAVRNRASNVKLIAAMAVAMLAGAVGGSLLSRRFAPPDRPALSFASVAADNAKAVVFIRTEFELLDSTTGQVSETRALSGSGFVISSSGLIVTNRHLIQDWEYLPVPGVTGRIKKLEVIFPGRRREEAVRAEVFRLSNDKEIDIAILKIAPQPGLPVVHGIEPNLDRINQGDAVAVIGYPLGFELTNEDRVETSLSTGVVSRVSQDLIQLNLRAYQGNSGGPVLNLRGEVIGILTANLKKAPDLTLCTPIGLAVELVEEVPSPKSEVLSRKSEVRGCNRES